MTPNRIIGYKNRIPWHIPEEMQHFKKCTMGHGVIMGRKTFESMEKALPGRTNIVLSRSPDLALPGCHIAYSLTEGMRCCQKQKKVFIIGGSMLYEQAMEHADTTFSQLFIRSIQATPTSR